MVALIGRDAGCAVPSIAIGALVGGDAGCAVPRVVGGTVGGHAGSAVPDRSDGTSNRTCCSIPVGILGADALGSVPDLPILADGGARYAIGAIPGVPVLAEGDALLSVPVGA